MYLEDVRIGMKGFNPAYVAGDIVALCERGIVSFSYSWRHCVAYAFWVWNHSFDLGNITLASLPAYLPSASNWRE